MIRPLAELAEEVDRNFEHDETMDVAAESIFGYYDQLRGMIRGRTATPSVTALILKGVNQQLGSVGLEPMSFVAFESYSRVGPEEQAKIALEGIATTLKTLLFQDPVLHFKHQKDIILDSFKSIEGKLAKYENKDAPEQGGVRAEKGKLGARIEIQSARPVSIFLQPGRVSHRTSLRRCLTTSRLEMHAHEISSRRDRRDQRVAILASGSAKDKASIDALAKKVEALRSPVELFDPASWVTADT